MTPPSPTAQTSSRLAPQIAVKLAVVPARTRDQLVPSKCKIVPVSPAAQTSFALAPHTPRSECPSGCGLLQHQSSALHSPIVVASGRGELASLASTPASLSVLVDASSGGR